MKQIKTNLYISVLIISSLLISSCAPKVYIKAFASDTIIRKNPMKEIALVADGRIENAFFTSREMPFLLLEDSKKALEKLLPQIKKGLEQKGYKVIFSEPVGIGYYSPFYHETRWLVDSRRIVGSQKLWIADYEPAYLYSVAKNNKKFEVALRNIFERSANFEQFEVNKKQVPVVVPLIQYVPKDIVQEIQEATGGDIICFIRIYGQEIPSWEKRFWLGYKIMGLALNVCAYGFIAKDGDTGLRIVGATAGYGFWMIPYLLSEKSSDALVVHFTCVDAKTGEIFLQYGIMEEENPVNPSKGYGKKVLKYFPAINETLKMK